MVAIILLLLGGAGITTIITWSHIMAPVRRLYPALLMCSLCTGFWTGALCGVYAASMDLIDWPYTALMPPSVALVSYLASLWIQLQDAKIHSAKQKEP